MPVVTGTLKTGVKKINSYGTQTLTASSSVALAAGLATAVAAPLFVAPPTGQLDLGFACCA